jgi:branched-subunit amino acid aminotransferase/4-amino-4-deoxychorismate lyase
VIDGRLVTPSVRSGVLRGITKATIQRIGAANGFEVQEADFGVAELARATECFITSATREVMPAAGVRLETGIWLEFPAGGGDVTRRVAKAYKNEVAK